MNNYEIEVKLPVNNLEEIKENGGTGTFHEEYGENILSEHVGGKS